MPSTALKKPVNRHNKAEDIFDLLRLSLDEIKTYLERPLHDDMEFTDFAARLNASNNRLDSLNKDAKGKIEALLTRNGKTISEGKNYFALLSTIIVTRLNTDKIKEFLGVKLKDFQKEPSEETRLTFKIKG